jgi:hypothetical protein
MVLDVSNPNTPVLYGSSAIGITQDVISLYDKTSSAAGPATVRPSRPTGTTAIPAAPKPAAARGAEVITARLDGLEQVSTASSSLELRLRVRFDQRIS